ncbi:hypothetical protein IW20_12775 [Flavobacterium hydatis]|uniref:Uncharacterized protein n=2 Tax=Flavobacterium hydatis TaxID=991 RepID=A0A086AGF8_FLAHY|nr:hypothetical protein IW20_12775 [Flavobacterium hydatis]
MELVNGIINKNMKKAITLFVLVLIAFIFGFNIYNSKKELYQKHLEFYNKNFTAEVEKIYEGRGTKIYYSPNIFFYNNYCEDEYKLKETIKVGDIIVKKAEILEVYRKDKSNKIITCKVINPGKSYFQYFSDL